MPKNYRLEYDQEYPKGSVIGDAVAGTPLFAPRGKYAIGVRTIEIVNHGQVDLKAVTENDPRPCYDRKLTVEVWYPAEVEEGTRQLSFYTDYIGGGGQQDFLEAYDYPGRAVRDAEPYAGKKPYPVLVVSHGYPGSRYLLSHLGENLATKGYVVFAIAHTDTTYTDFDPEISIISAMMYRTLDQRYMITALPELNREGFLKGLLDIEKVGVLGYSFGGFGLLRTLGVELTEGAKQAFPKYAGLLDEEAGYQGDKRVKAAVLFAPFGADYFCKDSLKNITAPTLWIQGNEDTVVPYPPVHKMFDEAVNSDRYFLTYDLMNHKAATNPSPLAAQKYTFAEGARRWDDWVWNQWHVNGINLHFITAFMDAHLKGEKEKLDYLNVKESVGRRCVISMKDGEPTPEHTYWKGFNPDHTTNGLILEHSGSEK